MRKMYTKKTPTSFLKVHCRFNSTDKKKPPIKGVFIIFKSVNEITFSFTSSMSIDLSDIS